MRLSRQFRILLAPLFGAGIALSFILGWLACGRAFAPRVEIAAGWFALAGFLSSSAALIASRILAQPWSAKMAAALFCLIAGTPALASLFMMLQAVLTHTRSPNTPMWFTIVVVLSSALYNVLSIAAPLIMPLGLPLIAVVAFLIARDPR